MSENKLPTMMSDYLVLDFEYFLLLNLTCLVDGEMF